MVFLFFCVNGLDLLACSHSDLILKSVGLLGWGISLLQGYYLHKPTQTQNKHRQTSMPQMGFEPIIPVFEQAKTFHASDHVATVISKYNGYTIKSEFV
jgi:hypothetical protein